MEEIKPLVVADKDNNQYKLTVHTGLSDKFPIYFGLSEKFEEDKGDVAICITEDQWDDILAYVMDLLKAREEEKDEVRRGSI